MTDLSGSDFGRLVTPECPDYVNSVGGQILVVADHYPIVLGWAFFFFSIRRSEFVAFYASLMLFVDWALNWGLRYLFRQAPPTPGCGLQYEMPALATQHSVCLVLFIMLVVVVWTLRLGVRNTLILFGFVGTVAYARVYIGKNSPEQLLAGAAVGTAHALVWFSLYHWVVHPRVERIIHWPLVRLGGFCNTLCAPPVAAAAAAARGKL